MKKNLLALSLLLAMTAPALASSHREAPGIAGDPLVDNTDVYAFTSPEAGRSDRVVLISNWIPLQKPESGPNFWYFDDQALYDIRVDNNGDALEDVSYQFQFSTSRQTGNTFLYNTGAVTSLTDPDLNVRQTYTLTQVRNGRARVLGTGLPVVPSFVGGSSMTSYSTLRTEGIKQVTDQATNDTRVFAGQRAEQFFLDLGAIFDLLQINTVNPRPAINSTFKSNVHTIALEIPKAALTRDLQAPRADLTTNVNGVIGVWSTTSRRQVSVVRGRAPVQSRGGFVQVSRLGNPLVNEVVIPLKDKDNFNGSHPRDDTQFLAYVQDPEPARLLTALFGVSVPPTPRADLVSIFLTGITGVNAIPGARPCEYIRLNLTTPVNAAPNRLGVIGGDAQGYPNGRRLGDDTVDISFRAVAGGTVLTPANNVSPNNALSDGVNEVDASQPFLTTFPFLADPTPGR